MVPIAQEAARYDLAQVTIEAIGTRRMHWPRAIKAICQDLGSYIIEQVRRTCPLCLFTFQGLDDPFVKVLAERLKENKVKVTYRYKNYIRVSLCTTRTKLANV